MFALLLCAAAHWQIGKLKRDERVKLEVYEDSKGNKLLRIRSERRDFSLTDAREEAAVSRSRYEQMQKAHAEEIGISSAGLRSDYYVYAHLDSMGSAFYIGKGTSRRAWVGERSYPWPEYVRDRLQGHYVVELLAEGMTEHVAELVEHRLQELYSKELIVGGSGGDIVDYAAYERFMNLSADARRVFTRARVLEERDSTEAERLYRESIRLISEASELRFEEGLAASFRESQPRVGIVNAIDRLTLLLHRAGRDREAVEAAREYFEKFAGDRVRSTGVAVLKRIARLERMRSE